MASSRQTSLVPDAFPERRAPLTVIVVPSTTGCSIGERLVARVERVQLRRAATSRSHCSEPSDEDSRAYSAVALELEPIGRGLDDHRRRQRFRLLPKWTSPTVTSAATRARRTGSEARTTKRATPSHSVALDVVGHRRTLEADRQCERDSRTLTARTRVADSNFELDGAARLDVRAIGLDARARILPSPNPVSRQQLVVQFGTRAAVGASDAIASLSTRALQPVPADDQLGPQFGEQARCRDEVVRVGSGCGTGSSGASAVRSVACWSPVASDALCRPPRTRSRAA